jgi:hypothetical protein
MRFPRQLVVLPWALALALLAREGKAWPREVHEQVAEQAGRLMPIGLRALLAQNLAQLQAGARAPLALEGDPTLYLRPDDASGTLDGSVLDQSQRLLDLVTRRAAWSTVAYEMGVLSHYVALAADPTHVATPSAREGEWDEDFRSFTAARLPRFRVVFDGYVVPSLERDDLRGFVGDLAERTRRLYPVLSASYVQRDGSVARGATFDDRHPVFGVASLSFSHAITDTARVWLYIWIRAGGDPSGLPFPGGFQPTTAEVEP